MKQIIIVREDLNADPLALAKNCALAASAWLVHAMHNGVMTDAGELQCCEELLNDAHAVFYNVGVRSDVFLDWVENAEENAVVICKVPDAEALKTAVAFALSFGLEEDEDIFPVAELDEKGKELARRGYHVFSACPCVGFRPIPDDLADKIVNSRFVQLYQ